MTTKRTSMWKMLTTVTVALLLCLALALPTLADDGLITWAPGTEANPAQAGLTKMLKMPIGTTTPNTTFEFVFTPKSYNGDLTDTNMPRIGDDNRVVKIQFTTNDKGATVGNIKTVIKESGDLLKNLVWTRAGVYVYTVTEKKTTFTNSFAEKMTFTNAVYDLYVYVKEGEKGLYVYLVGALIKVEDTEEGGDEGEKVDPTPGGQDPHITGKYSQMIFTNFYLKNNGGTDPDKDSVLQISKTVSDGYGDRQKEFAFTVTVINPGTVKEKDTTYQAQKMTAAGKVGPVLVFTTAKPQDITLKHGEWLSFYDLPVGSGFEVTEKATADYTPKYQLTLNKIEQPVVNGAVNTALGFPSITDAEPKTVSDNKGNPDKAAFTNTYKDIILTGISVDNLPYVVIIALALLCLAGFTAVKFRRYAKSAA